MIINVHFEMTNNNGHLCSLEDATDVHCFRDGIGLLKGYPKNEPRADFGIEEDIKPGRLRLYPDEGNNIQKSGSYNELDYLALKKER